MDFLNEKSAGSSVGKIFLADLLTAHVLEGMWFSDENATHDVKADEGFWQILGYQEYNASNLLDHIDELIFQEDKDRLIWEISSELTTDSEHKQNEFRFIHKNGNVIWFRTKRIFVNLKLDGAPKYIWVLSDITSIKRNEEFLDRCNTEAKIGFWEVDMIHKNVFWSKITKDIFEVSEDFKPGPLDAVNFIKERKYREKVKNAIREGIKTGKTYEFELEIITAKGNSRWTKAIGIPKLVKGKCTRIYGTFQNINDSKLKSIKLDEINERLEMATSTSMIGIWDFNLIEHYMICDDVMCTLYDLPWTGDKNAVEDLQSRIHPDDLAYLDEQMKKAILGHQDFDAEFRIIIPEKGIRYLKSRAIIERDNNGVAVRMLGTNWDITRQKNKEHRINQSYLRNKAFIEQTPTAIAMFDTEMKYLAASARWVEDYGLKGKELLGHSHYEIFPEISEEWKQIHRECLNGKTHKNEEDKFLRADGSVQWLKWEDKPWYEDSGKIGGIIMYTEDISETKKVQEQLKISEEAFRGNFENAAIGMAILNNEGKWIKVNPKVCRMLGYTEEELLNIDSGQLTHLDDKEADETLMLEMQSGKRESFQFEKRYLNKDGQVVFTIHAASSVKNGEGETLYSVVQLVDISILKRAEKKLAVTLDQYQSIMDASTEVAIISTDRNGIIKTFNRGAEKMFGYMTHEVINQLTPKAFHEPNEVINRSKELSLRFGRIIEGFETFTISAREGNPETREWTFIKKDGVKFPVQLTVSAIKFNGEVTGFLGVAVDISDLKSAQNEVQSLLEVAQDQNVRLKNFAHIVSHNLRSHSGNIEFLLDLLISDVPELKTQETLKHILNASKSLSETISHLNEVALINTRVTENLEYLNVNEYAVKAINSVSALAMESRVKIINEIDPKHEVLALPAYLDSIILNFLTNGIKYHASDRESFVKLSSKIKHGEIIIEIEDNGLGIDLKMHGSKLFGMYKTFHSNRNSRGIGLFITKNQIEALGGKIKVESTVGKGSKFFITLKNEKN